MKKASCESLNSKLVIALSSASTSIVRVVILGNLLKTTLIVLIRCAIAKLRSWNPPVNCLRQTDLSVPLKLLWVAHLNGRPSPAKRRPSIVALGVGILQLIDVQRLDLR